MDGAYRQRTCIGTDIPGSQYSGNDMSKVTKSKLLGRLFQIY